MKRKQCKEIDLSTDQLANSSVPTTIYRFCFRKHRRVSIFNQMEFMWIAHLAAADIPKLFLKNWSEEGRLIAFDQDEDAEKICRMMKGYFCSA